MKKILFITWTTSLGGGAEKILSNLTTELEIEYKIDVLEIGKWGKHKLYLGERVKLLKPLLNKIDDNRIIYLFKRCMFGIFPMFMKNIRCKFKKYDYEISFNYLYPTYILAKASKTIAWNHGSIENLLEKSQKKNRKKYCKALANVNKIVAISNKTQKSIIDVYPEYENKVVKIYNGYKFDDIIKKANEKVIIDGSDYLIFLGRLEEEKGIKRLLNLYFYLHKQGIKQKLYLLGEGPLKSWIENFIKKNKLVDSVKLLGYVGNPYPYIKNASYILMTSVAEGFPTVFAEGLSLGIGFVSTVVGGSEELSNFGKCGFISDNDEKLVTYLKEELLKNKEDRVIKKEVCLEHVKNFSLEKQVLSLKNLLEELDNE